MEITKKPIDAVKYAPYNARTMKDKVFEKLSGDEKVKAVKMIDDILNKDK